MDTQETVSNQFLMPLLPLRGVLVLPYGVMQLEVGRDKSIKAVNEVLKDEEKEIVLAMQQDIHIDEPTYDDIYHMGVLVRVKQVMRPSGGTLRIIVEGLKRVEILGFTGTTNYIEVNVRTVDDGQSNNTLEAEVYSRHLMAEFEAYSRLSKRVPAETLATVLAIEDPAELADTIASHLVMKLSEKQDYLETIDVTARLEMLLTQFAKETEILSIDRKINAEVRKQMEKNQKEYYLREQIKAIHKELGEEEDRESEAAEYRQKIKQLKMPKAAEEKTLKELGRLEKMPSSVAEYTVLRNYLDWMTELPWSKETKDRRDLVRAEEILEEDHYGLEEVKERILEYLAVNQLAKKLKGPIICLSGPPGVGKTSLGKSIARALNRNFVRMSLGGIKDEAEIRGHRRTYVGALPGRIIQNMKNAGSKNPVFLLDEVDKLGNDYKGDPSSALLEVLDPEQNFAFSDHFIETPYDLSKVMFITTANVKYNIPRPLLDRMEVIEISGYTEEEKLAIAMRHLIPQQLEKHALKPEQIQISENAVRTIIREYTREAGVRNLDRNIASLCRKVAKDVVQGKSKFVKISVKNIRDYLGIPRFQKDKAREKPTIGVVTGLAWTEVGGEILQVEAQVLPGSGKLHLTGKLGDVMKESAQAGLTYVRSIGHRIGLKPHFEEKLDIHIHVPEGAIPKDGPSAGVTMATALASQLMRRTVRSDLAMTGEITLVGRVLPVGGIKEKVLAAYATGIRTIILPADNEKDLEKLPENIRRKIDFHLCSHMDEVMEIALLDKEPEEAGQ